MANPYGAADNALAGTNRALGAGGLAVMTLNFVIESALYNDFLHHEATQLCIRTLKSCRKHVTCAEYKWLYERAVRLGLLTGIKAHEDQGFLNPWGDESFQWLFQKFTAELNDLKPDCDNNPTGYSQDSPRRGGELLEGIMPPAGNIVLERTGQTE